MTVNDLYMLNDNIGLATKWFILDVSGTPAKIIESNEDVWGCCYYELLDLRLREVEHWYNLINGDEVIVWLK